MPTRGLDLAIRCWVLGATAGTVLGAVVGTLAWPLFGTVIGAIAGFVAGFGLGALNSVVLVVLTRHGAHQVHVAVAGAVTSTLGVGGIALALDVTGDWALLLVAAAAIAGGVLAPVAIGRATPVASAPRTIVIALIAGSVLGVVAGTGVGLAANPPTAPFAAIEVGVAGAVGGVLVGLLVVAVRTAAGQCGQRAPVSGR